MPHSGVYKAFYHTSTVFCCFLANVLTKKEGGVMMSLLSMNESFKNRFPCVLIVLLIDIVALLLSTLCFLQVYANITLLFEPTYRILHIEDVDQANERSRTLEGIPLLYTTGGPLFYRWYEMYVNPVFFGLSLLAIILHLTSYFRWRTNSSLMYSTVFVLLSAFVYISTNICMFLELLLLGQAGKV